MLDCKEAFHKLCTEMKNPHRPAVSKALPIYPRARIFSLLKLVHPKNQVDPLPMESSSRSTADWGWETILDPTALARASRRRRDSAQASDRFLTWVACPIAWDSLIVGEQEIGL